jgi:hypothetical protein
VSLASLFGTQGLCLTIEHSSERVGAFIDLYECEAKPTTLWNFDPATNQIRDDLSSGALCMTACPPATPTPKPAPALPTPSPSAVLALDPSKLGLRHDGITAMSVNGAGRLLHEYPEPTRSEILDMLFTPGLGTAWQMLKIEIGGDCQSSYGLEPSFMHIPQKANASFDRGYQFWFIQEARKRNPSIPLLCLSWGLPYWIKGGVLSPDGVQYHIDFLLGAKQHHNVTFDWIGIWNEAPWTADYIEGLHTALLSNGLSTQIVAADGGTDVISAAVKDSKLAAAIGAFGIHTAHMVKDKDVENFQPQKPYWDSENDMVDGPMPQWKGTGNVALGWPQTFLTNYINANSTNTMLCAFVHSWWVGSKCRQCR